MALPASISASIAQQEDQLLRMGSQARFDKIRERTLFSSFLFCPGQGGVIRQGKYNLFTTPRGQAGQGYANSLTDRETNWVSSGSRVPNEQNLIVRGLGVRIRRPTQDTTVYPAAVLPSGAVAGKVDLLVPVHAQDVVNIAQGMILCISHMDNEVPFGMVSDFPAVGGAHGWVQAGRQMTLAAAVPPAEATPVIAAPGPFARAYLPVTGNTTPAAFERRPKVAYLLGAGESFTVVLNVPRDITLQAQTTSAQAEDNYASGAVEVVVELFCTESYANRG